MSGIRAARPQDLGAILDVINRTNRAFYKAIVSPDRYREPFLELRDVEDEAERMAFHVYEESGRIVGVVALEARPGAVGVVGRLYVLPGAQRKGIGAALLACLESLARRDGLRELVVWTDANAAWAVAFYRRQGYREIEPETAFEDPYIDERAGQHPRTLQVLHKRL